jgi:hypothetical protein
VLASREWKVAATFAHHWNWFVREMRTLIMWPAVHVPFSVDEAVAEIDAI